MTFADIPLLLVLLPLVAASGLCSASETVLFSLTHLDRVRLGRVSPGAAAAVAVLVSRPRQLLVSVLVLNTCVNVAYFVVTSVLSRRIDHPFWEPLFSIAAVIALLLGGEVLPKVVGSGARVTVARRLGRAMLAVFRGLGPVRVIVEALAITPLTRLIRPTGAEQSPPITPEELSALLEHGAQKGAIDEDEQRLLAEVVELGTTRVREIMTPRVDIRWLDAGTTADDFLDLVRKTGASRFPVVDGSPDERVLGWATTQRFIAARASGLDKDGPRLADILEPIHFVPDRARLDQLLDEFRRQRTHVALCVDEFGAVTGMIHIQHVVGELLTTDAELAQAQDEHVRPLGEGRWLVPGRLGVRDWAEFLGPAGTGVARDRRASTVAGLILQTLGPVPKEGDAVRLGNMRLEVKSMRGPVIQRVIVSAHAAEGQT